MTAMRGKMRPVPPILAMVMVVLLGACASPITHPVALTYTGHAGPTVQRPVAVGIQPFADRRAVEDRRVIGYRSLGRGEYERYVSDPDDVARSVTRMATTVVRQKGGDPKALEGWDFSPEQMMNLTDAYDVLIGGEIRTLRCDAEKRLMHTRMVLEVDIVVHVGRVREGVVHRRPVNVRSERVEAVFGPRELGRHMNDMISEALERGLQDVP